MVVDEEGVLSGFLRNVSEYIVNSGDYQAKKMAFFAMVWLKA